VEPGRTIRRLTQVREESHAVRPTRRPDQHGCIAARSARLGAGEPDHDGQQPAQQPVGRVQRVAADLGCGPAGAAGASGLRWNGGAGRRARQGFSARCARGGRACAARSGTQAQATRQVVRWGSGVLRLQERADPA